jgi:hypothetical protein
MKRPEKLLQIVEMVASGVLVQSKAAKACDVSPSQYWAWVAASQRDPEAFSVSFCGEVMAFHKALGLARKLALQDVLGHFEERCLRGSDEVVYYQGRPQFKEREDCAGLDDETVTKIMGLPDRYERDAKGNRVYLKIHHEPPVAAVVKLLESNFRQYHQRSEVNVNQKVSGGVHVVASKKPAALPQPVTVLSSVPAAQTAPVPLAIEPPTEIEESADDDLDFLDGEDDAPRAAPTPTPAPQPEPVPAVSEPPAAPLSSDEQARQYERKLIRPLSQLEQDLLQRLRNRPENAKPIGLVSVGRPEPDDLDPRRQGPGTFPSDR